MIVGKAIYYLLTNATGVTDIVSTRVYPEVAQQDAALPYIVYNVANNEPTDTKPEPSPDYGRGAWRVVRRERSRRSRR